DSYISVDPLKAPVAPRVFRAEQATRPQYNLEGFILLYYLSQENILSVLPLRLLSAASLK
ncbi:hypothetical protein, partial [Cronobacter sakazakii]|uniref:hypothetical protein n=1 Tax=Cronobacter sakazakii TaxID=28141 RepID=UPI001F256A22